MDVEPEIAFRNVEATDPLKQQILDGIDKLEEVYDHIITCRIMVEETNPGRKSGKLNHVRLEISIPDHDVVVNRDPPEHPASQDLKQAVNQAFDVARRRLRKLKEKRRAHVKEHGLPPHGRIVRLLADDTGVQYGFLISGDGREIYFNENALVDLEWHELEIGDEVRFAESGGDEGPMASTVAPLAEDDLTPKQEKEVPLRER